MAVRYEIVSLAPKRLEASSSQMTKRPYNAALALIDGAGAARPYLAEALPQLHSETWKVLPDGRMETAYRLRPGLTWHDGQPLTPDDFSFAYQVYATPGLGAFSSSPQDLIEEVIGADSQTVLVRWRSLFGDAGALVDGHLDPLPRHILDAPFSAYQRDPSTLDSFLAHPYWTSQYVGLGPYQLTRWEPGVQLEGRAFGGHALGRPKIERIVLRIIQDENTTMANVIAGSVDFAGDNAIRFEHAAEIKRQLGDRAVALMRPGPRHYLGFQFRTEILRTPSLLDLRVRRALAHAIDREPINLALFEGQGMMVHHWVPPQAPYFDEVERIVTKYPFDPRRTEQLLTEAGFTKDGRGFYRAADGQPFKPQLMVDGSPFFERELDIIQHTWAGLGIEVEPRLLPAAESRILASRTTFPDMYAISTGNREAQLDVFSAAQIATAARGWAGANRVGWQHPDFERAWAAYNSLLDRNERSRQIVEMMRVLTDQLPAIFLYFNIGPIAHTADLHGPEMGTPESLFNWNQHEWTW